MGKMNYSNYEGYKDYTKDDIDRMTKQLIEKINKFGLSNMVSMDAIAVKNHLESVLNAKILDDKTKEAAIWLVKEIRKMKKIISIPTKAEAISQSQSISASAETLMKRAVAAGKKTGGKKKILPKAHEIQKKIQKTNESHELSVVTDDAEIAAATSQVKTKEEWKSYLLKYIVDNSSSGMSSYMKKVGMIKKIQKTNESHELSVVTDDAEIAAATSQVKTKEEEWKSYLLKYIVDNSSSGMSSYMKKVGMM